MAIGSAIFMGLAREIAPAQLKYARIIGSDCDYILRVEYNENWVEIPWSAPAVMCDKEAIIDIIGQLRCAAAALNAFEGREPGYWVCTPMQMHPRPWAWNGSDG